MNLSKIKNITFKKLHFIFLFILLTFLVRFESYQPISENFIFYSNNSDIELIVSNDVKKDKINDSSFHSQQKIEQSDNFDLTGLPDYKLSLLHFNQTINHKFISIEQSFIQFHSYISSIQKNNIWQQNTYDADDFSS